MLTIHAVRDGVDLDCVHALFEEYAASLGIDLGFQGFAAELTGLPGEYAPPRGCLLLARWQGEVAGCVALRALDEVTAEMKRLYVRRQLRGHGIARSLVNHVIGVARSGRYARMRLDTLPWMTAAMRLYESVGFRRIAPYRENPVEGAVFMELTLD
jgi:ribosomal protein S18 acetylase RimI-like enzyme